MKHSPHVHSRHLNHKTLIIIGALALILTIGCAIFMGTNVPQGITQADSEVFKAKLHLDSGSAPSEYSAQIALIAKVQAAIFALSPGNAPIPPRTTREPTDLVFAQHGECFDRSRTLDKALRYIGFKTRYASIYSHPKGWGIAPVLLSQGGTDFRSHALVEVLTAKGWMFVDSVTPWLALDRHKNPVSLRQWQRQGDKANYVWLAQGAKARIHPLLQSDFIVVYGLYSRHGLYYPPYVPLPDLDWTALSPNFFS